MDGQWWRVLAFAPGSANQLANFMSLDEPLPFPYMGAMEEQKATPSLCCVLTQIPTRLFLRLGLWVLKRIQ